MGDRGDDPGIERTGSESPGGRAPRGWLESVIANCRPQPAIPALLVLLLTTLVPVTSQSPPGAPPADASPALMLLVPVGILASCGLAIAAGFCSLFPTAAWIALAFWVLRFTQPGGPLPAYNAYVIGAGVLAATAMFVIQLWRIRTRRFVPTIRDERGPYDDAAG